MTRLEHGGRDQRVIEQVVLEGPAGFFQRRFPCPAFFALSRVRLRPSGQRGKQASRSQHDDFQDALQKNAAFVPASYDQRPDTMRVVFVVQKVDVPERNF